MKHIDLKGKRVLVTGGSQGIGAEICRQMAYCGADVAINFHKNKEKAQSLAVYIEKEYMVNTVCIGADVTNAQEVSQMFSEMDNTIGPVDILVNNAGCETVSHVLELSESDWDRVINVNLKGPFLCSKEAGLRMENSEGGVIINISSIHDVVPRKGLVHYCAAKAGLKMLSKCLSLELADNNIRVVSIAPGAIETDMNRDEIATFGKDKFNGWIPLGRIGEVGDVASVAVFMASDLASYINGTDIYIDGSYMNNTIQYDPRPKRTID